MSINSPANQYALDPRQKLCWDFYVNPKSETFGNALQSAIKAGYEESYGRTITDTEWFREKVRRLQMLGKAEKVLDETLTTPHMDEEGKVDSSILRVKTDVAKHITSTLGRNEGYSTKVETDITSGGEKIETTNPVIAALAKKYEEELRNNI